MIELTVIIKNLRSCEKAPVGNLANYWQTLWEQILTVTGTVRASSASVGEKGEESLSPPAHVRAVDGMPADPSRRRREQAAALACGVAHHERAFLRCGEADS